MYPANVAASLAFFRFFMKSNNKRRQSPPKHPTFRLSS